MVRRIAPLLIALGLLLGCQKGSQQSAFSTFDDDLDFPGVEGSEPEIPSQAPQWKLLSPSNNSTSSDTTPKLVASGFSQFDGSNVTVYSDSACTQKVAQTEVDKGEFTVDSISLADDGSDDGLVQFYARFESGACENLDLSYTLDTKLPIAAATYFRLMWKDDPSTTATLGFAANSLRSSDHKIYYGTEDHGRDISAYTHVVSPDLISDYKGMYNAMVRLKSLKADQQYYFVVSDSKGVSARYWFKTAPNSVNSKLSLIAGGDSRNNRTPRKNANLLVAKLRPDAVMFGGDYTSSGTDTQWQEWMQDWQMTIAKDGRLTPIIATRGNHERSNEILQKLFDTPAGVYYGTSIGGSLLRIYTLNSEAAVVGAQTDWLVGDLNKAKSVLWKFAQYHRPMRPHTAGKGDGSSLYKSWANAFYEHKMTLVSEADAHTTKTTWPIRPSTATGNMQGFVRDDANGTIYVGEGAWGAPLRSANDVKAWTRAAGSFNHFNWIFVTRDKIEVRVVKIDNAATVGWATESSKFSAPAKLEIWKPNTGDVITIQKSTALRGLAGQEAHE